MRRAVAGLTWSGRYRATWCGARCLAAGANKYLSKPVSLHDLLETIARLLPRAPSYSS